MIKINTSVLVKQILQVTMNLNTVSNIRILQASHVHTGSTVLFNILQGFFCPLEPCQPAFCFLENNLGKLFTQFFVIKTHCTNIRRIIKLNPEFDLFFITSSREGHKAINLSHPRLLTINYEELLETSTNSVENIVKNVAVKCCCFLPSILTEHIDINASINRVKNMNGYYKEIQNKPFEIIDNMYGLHGSHKNRKTRIDLDESQISVVNFI